MSSWLLYAAWLIALIAMGGSLYFSEVNGFTPCELCWYQRILMYPLVLILGVAAYRRDLQITGYVLALSLIGTGLSFYHYLVQKVPAIAQTSSCTVGVPCSGVYINWLGFITIPFLALTAFVLISILMWMIRVQIKNISG
ncbi:disulfide bond formation protein B [Hazenella sp. IB182353]|nr:disulfide bond formation protein B [Polycladospora coralii]